MMTITILSVLLVVSFVGITIWRTHKVPESISAMVYLLPALGGWRWLWSIWLWMVAILTLAPAMEILDAKGLGFLAFIPMVCLLFVGGWPLFDSEHRSWHYVLAIIAGVMTQVCVAFICPWWLLLWLIVLVPVLSGLAAFNDYDDDAEFCEGYGVFFVEVICYVALISSELVH